MYYKNKSYNNALQKVTINFGKLIGEKEDEDAYIVLKELPTMETLELKEAQEKGELELMKYFKHVLPSIIVDHNLWESDEKKMSNEDVISFVFEKLDLTTKVISEYTDGVFTSRLNKKDDK